MEDLTCSTTGRITVVKMAILPHTSYIFNTVSQFHSILQEIEKNNFKFCLNTYTQTGWRKQLVHKRINGIITILILSYIQCYIYENAVVLA